MFLGRALLSLPLILRQHCCCRLGPQLPIPYLPPQTREAAGAAIYNLHLLLDPCPWGPQWCFVFRASGTVCPRNAWEMGERKGGATAVQNAVCSSSSDASPPAFLLLPLNSKTSCGPNGAGAQQRLLAWHPLCASPPTLVLWHTRKWCHDVNALFTAWQCTKTVRKSFGKWIWNMRDWSSSKWLGCKSCALALGGRTPLGMPCAGLCISLKAWKTEGSF